MQGKSILIINERKGCLFSITKTDALTLYLSPKYEML